MAHTKGNWNIVDDININADNGLSIATVFWNNEPHHTTMVSKQEGVCNRHIIAAAPDLLEACKMALHTLDMIELTREPGTASNKLFNAIQKATTIKI